MAGLSIGSANASAIQALATEFGLPFTAVPAAPGGQAWRLKPLRLGLYRPYRGGNMDEGWTRFIFDQWEFPYARVEADEIRKGGLNDRYDALLFADDDLRTIMGAEGNAPDSDLYPGADNYPPEYRQGLGDAGVQAVKEFVRNGGSLVLFDGATALATEKFGLPVKNVVAGLSTKEFFAPGSTLRVQMDPRQPLAYGMPRHALIVFFDSAVFDIGNSLANDKISVVARYGERDVLRGGWLDGEKRLAQQAALLDVGYGKGRIALIGFRPQNRAQAHGTFKVLFNALYQAGATEGAPTVRTSAGQ